MDTTIVAVYVICADLLIALHHSNDCRAEVTDAEVMTTTLVAMLYFNGNFEKARVFMTDMGYIPNMLSKSRFNRRLHRIKPLFLTLFALLDEYWKELNERAIYSIDTFPVPVCDNYRIPRCPLYQSEDYRGYIASKKQYYYGLKLYLMITEQGQPSSFSSRRLPQPMWKACNGFNSTCQLIRPSMPTGATITMPSKMTWRKSLLCFNRCAGKTQNGLSRPGSVICSTPIVR
jgi:hypothetical protein